MIPNHRFFISRIHFLIQLLVLQCLFCGLFLLTSGRELGTDRAGSMLFFAIGSLGIALTQFVEFLTREASERSLSGLGKARKSAICYRQMVFLMSTIFASMIFGPEHSTSNLLFPLFAISGGLWLVWSNLVGHRMLHRRLYRPAQSAKYLIEAKEVSFPATV